MEQENSETIVVYAPRMHAALIPEAVPAAVFCFNPGLGAGLGAGQASERGLFTPAALPLDAAKAKAWLRSMLEWGLQFDSPGQLTAMAVAEALQKQRNVSGMDPGELADLQRFAAGSEAQVPQSRESARAAEEQAAKLQAQLRLLLAWNLEERAKELADLGQGLASQYQRFGQALGLGEGDDEDESRDAGLSAPLLSQDAEDSLPHAEILASMLAFVPPGSCVYSDNPALTAVWREQGLEFKPFEDDEDSLAKTLGSKTSCCRAPGWRLAGLPGPDVARPWLDAAFLAVLPLAAG